MSRRERHAQIDWAEINLMERDEPRRAKRRRISAETGDGKRAIQIERAQSPAKLERAAKKLKSAPAEERVLSVPQWRMAEAEAAMRKAGVSGVVSNLCGSQRKRIGSKQR